MKVNHVDLGTALRFQWTYIPSNHGSQSATRKRSSSNNESSNTSPSSPAFPRSRFHHAACLMGRFVYIFGGKDRYAPLRDLWRLDTVTQEWEQVENAKSRLPHLQGHTMLAYKSQLLIFGGTFGDNSDDTPLWTYNTDLNYVHKFCCESFTVRPVGRREHSAVIYKTSMYIYGGFLDSSGSTDEFWAFSIEEEEWRMIRRHKPGKRHGHVTAVSDNKMWLHGGMRGLMALSDLWTFSFGTNTWTKVRTVGVSPGLSNHTAHVVGNSIILFGGSKSGTLSQDFWMLRFDTLTWRNVSTQNGDLCPPITLHTSILLNSALVQSTIADRTQSVPQLKGRPVLSLEMKSARPWTSPAASSLDSDFSLPSSAASQGVNILRLDTLGKNLDGNNNSSEEDILHIPERRRTETETSFSSLDNVQTLHDKSKTQQLTDNSARATDLACSGQQTGQCSDVARLRAASAENCGDAIPLLSRFHSLTSEVDLGENNLTITLSDEEIFDPVLSKLNESIELYKNNLSAECNKYTDSSHEDLRGRIPDTFLREKFSDKEFETKDELVESLAMFNRGNDSEFLCMDLSHIKNSTRIRKAMSADPSCVEMDVFQINDRNVAVSNLQNTEQMATNSFPKKVCEPCDQYCLSNDHKHLTSKTETTFPILHSVSDLIIEDLESSDVSEILSNIQISCPRRPYLRSASLKDLYDCVSSVDDYVESDFETCALTKSQLTKSCGSLASWKSSKFYEKKLDYQTFLVENTKNSSLEMQPKNDIYFSQSETNSGKYIKHVASVTWKNSSHYPRSRGNLSKFSNCGKISIGTQTTGSQTLLPNIKIGIQTTDPQTLLPSARIGSQTIESQTLLPNAKLHLNLVVDHFFTPLPTKTDSDKREAVQTAQRQPKPVVTRKSIFMSTNVCILVIGGQTESHGFQTEPLKMWLCCLY